MAFLHTVDPSDRTAWRTRVHDAAAYDGSGLHLPRRNGQVTRPLAERYSDEWSRPCLHPVHGGQIVGLVGSGPSSNTADRIGVRTLRRFQRIAHWGACRKTPVGAQNR